MAIIKIKKDPASCAKIPKYGIKRLKNVIVIIKLRIIPALSAKAIKYGFLKK